MSPGRKPSHPPLPQHGDTRRHGQIGLARAGRTEAENQLVLHERAQIDRLVRRARSDHAPVGPQRQPLGLAVLAQEPDPGHAHRRHDLGLVELVAALGALIEVEQRQPCGLGLLALDGQDVAAGEDGHAQLLLDACEVAVVFAEHLHAQAVVVEHELAPRQRLDKRGHGFQAAHSSLSRGSRPARLCGMAAAISTATRSPIAWPGASRWTACR
jgi:hypothetical protein